MATLKLNNTQSQNVKFNGFDVSVITLDGQIVWQKQSEETSDLDYMWVENTTDVDVNILSLNGGNYDPISESSLTTYEKTYNYKTFDLEYSTNKKMWNTATINCRYPNFVVPAKTKYYIRATRDNNMAVEAKNGMPLTYTYLPGLSFLADGCNYGGNPMSTLYGSKFNDYNEVPDYGFAFMFSGGLRKITKVDITLPDGWVGYMGYGRMFSYYGYATMGKAHVSINIDDNGDSHINNMYMLPLAMYNMFNSMNAYIGQTKTESKTIYVHATNIPEDAMNSMFSDIDNWYINLAAEFENIGLRGCSSFTAYSTVDISAVSLAKVQTVEESGLSSAFCGYKTNAIQKTIKGFNPTALYDGSLSRIFNEQSVDKLPVIAINCDAIKDDYALSEFMGGLTVNESSPIPMIVDEDYWSNNTEYYWNSSGVRWGGLFPNMNGESIYIFGQYDDIPNCVYSGKYLDSLSVYIDKIKSNYPNCTLYCDVYEDECRYYDVIPCSYDVDSDYMINNVYPR